MPLGDIIGRDVLARFHKAAPFAVFHGLARRKHHADIFARHDGVILLGRERLHRLGPKHIGQVLLFFKREYVLCGGSFENRHMRRKRRECKEQECYYRLQRLPTASSQ